MSGILNSGKLSTLISRLTSTRASNLDNLDSAVSDCTQASVWTPTKAGYLDAAISSVGGEAPPTTIASSTASYTLGSGVVLLANAPRIGLQNETVVSGSTQNTYKVMKTVSGSGIISLLGIAKDGSATPSPTATMQARLKIDGNVVWTSDEEAVGGYEGWCPIGHVYDVTDLLAFESVPFSTSFALELRNTLDTSTENYYILSRYRLTS